MDGRLKSGIALGVFVVWAGMAFVGAITKDYTGLTIVSPVMLLVSGYAFGREIVDKVRGSRPDA